MTTTNDWIRMSDRKPTEADLPVWAFYADHPQRSGVMLIAAHEHPPAGCDCWQKADIPAPPKEPTQRERDAQAFEGWDSSGDGHSWHHQTAANRRNTWHAALAWERAEMAKLLAEYFTRLDTEHRSNTLFAVQRTDIAVLRARLLT